MLVDATVWLQKSQNAYRIISCKHKTTNIVTTCTTICVKHFGSDRKDVKNVKHAGRMRLFVNVL